MACTTRGNWGRGRDRRGASGCCTTRGVRSRAAAVASWVRGRAFGHGDHRVHGARRARGRHGGPSHGLIDRGWRAARGVVDGADAGGSLSGICGSGRGSVLELVSDMISHTRHQDSRQNGHVIRSAWGCILLEETKAIAVDEMVTARNIGIRPIFWLVQKFLVLTCTRLARQPRWPGRRGTAS